MSASGLAAATAMMRTDGISEAAIGAFGRFYDQLASGATGLIREADIDPVTDLPHLDDVVADEASRREALAATAVLRLNGGLGTSMGMSRAKTLLRARGDATFLDVIVRQVLATRARHGVPLPLLFMNSFATSTDTLAALAPYDELAVPGLPLEIVQSREPKLSADTLEPVRWERDPGLEWCPPGHGDVYPSLLASGVLDALRERGVRYLFVANGDNLGAAPDGRLAAWFAGSGAPYAAEVTPRIPMDRKGGHLARRRADGRLVLRDTAQTSAEEMVHFTDETRHPFAHCNSIWFDLEALAAALDAHGGVLPLPLIRNAKTVDPRDPTSTPVVQIESAIGAAIEVFEGATAIVVPRSRFVPVKTCADLLVLRSDVYSDGPQGALERADPGAALPDVALDPAHYRLIDQLEARFPDGPPSLREARALRVSGDWTFGAGVRCVGDVRLDDAGEPRALPGGTVLGT